MTVKLKTLYNLGGLLFIFGATFSTAIYAAGPAAAPKSTAMPLDSIVAIVDEDVITQTQLNRQISLIKQQVQSTGASLPPADELRKKVLDQMIDKSLIIQIAKRNKVAITDAQLDQALSTIAARNKMTPAQLQTAVQNSGMNFDNYRKQIREQMLISDVEQHVIGPQIKVSTQEVDNYMRQHPGQNMEYHLYDLYVPLPASATPEQSQAAKNQAEVLMQKIKQTKDVKQLQQPGMKIDDMGWRAVNDIPSIFAKDLPGMKVNDVAGPITAPNGIHLIKLIATKSSGPALTRIQAQQILQQQKFTDALKPWLAKIRKDAYVKIMQQQ